MSTYNSIIAIHSLVNQMNDPNLTPIQKKKLYHDARKHMKYISTIKLTNLSDSTLLKLDSLLKTAKLHLT